MPRPKGSKNKLKTNGEAVLEVKEKVKAIEGEVWKKWHHEASWFFRNILTGEEKIFNQLDEAQMAALAEFEKGKTLVYD